VSITRTMSNSTCDGKTSNSRRPPPSSTGIDRSAARPASRPRAPVVRCTRLHVHLPVPGGGLRLSHRSLDCIGHVGHQRIAETGSRTGRAMAGHEDRDAVLNITTPVIHELRGAPSREHGTRRVHFCYHLCGRPGQLYELPPGRTTRATVWPSSPPRKSSGSAMYPSSDIDTWSTDTDISTSCGLDPGLSVVRLTSMRRTVRAGIDSSAGNARQRHGAAFVPGRR
jgi:hypothetical protein